MIVIDDAADLKIPSASAGPTETSIAIIGAGPYGLSIAAHFRERGIDHKIFGVPMEVWRSQMPLGTRLKSEGFASSLSDAKDAFTLGAFCSTRRIPYADVGIPVPVKTFSEYGLEFQARFVPDLDSRKVTRIAQAADGFALTLEDETLFMAKRVIVAVGISHYGWLPPELEGVSERLVSHTSAHHRLEKFAGQKVTVIGSGASAVGIAALLHEAGAKTSLVARTKALTFHDPPKLRRSLYERIRHPQSGLGPSPKSFFYSYFPDVFARLSPVRRARIVKKALPPSACWFTKTTFVGKVTTYLGQTIDSVEVADDRVVLTLRDGQSRTSTVESDHVIAGTGYRVDLARLTFLPESLRSQIDVLEGSPVLDRNFESSVPGLYFVGLSAAVSFGPLLRFAYGARFAARRLTAHVVRVLR